jgi:hypothetical protein
VCNKEKESPGGVSVVVADRLLLGFVAKLVTRADDLPAFDAGAGHPDGQRARVMVPPEAELRDRHPAEFAVPDHERRIEQTARLQVSMT